MTTDFTGDKQFDRRLARLATKDAKRIRRRAVNKGLTQLSKAVKKEAPSRRVRKSIGKRNKKNRRTGIAEAKVGTNVGKKHGSSTRMPHAHLVALGTGERRRRKLGGWAAGRSLRTRTGRMMPVDRNFVRRGAYRALPAVKREITDSVYRDLQKVKP